MATVNFNLTSMVKVKRLILDVLKPHQPNGLEFATSLAEQSPDCYIKFSVVEVDEQTESVILTIDGEDIPRLSAPWEEPCIVLMKWKL